MANEIRDAINTAFADGPALAPSAVPKPLVRQAGKTIQDQFDGLKAVAAGKWVSFATVAGMNADLGYSNGTEGRVYNDPGRGVYRKNGAVGAGSWSYIGPTPESDTTQIEADVAALNVLDLVALVEPGGNDPIYDGGLFYDEDVPIVSPRRDGGRAEVRGHLRPQMMASVCHIILMGQSNQEGADAFPPLTTTPQQMGGYMPRKGIQTWNGFILSSPLLSDRGTSAFDIAPLKERQYLVAGETISSGVTAQIKTKLAGGPFAGNQDDTHPKIVFSYPHRGARSLYELGPVGGAVNGHWQAFADDIDKIKASANKEGYDYDVPAMMWNQGEDESGGRLDPGGPILGYDALVAGYGARLADYYGQWNAVVKAKTGRLRNVPMFIEQTVTHNIGMAQLNVANEYREIFVVGPQYQYPSGLNNKSLVYNGQFLRGDPIHRSADGKRWAGEMAGKVLWRVLFEGENWRPLECIDGAKESDTKVRLRMHVPRPPLVWEATYLPDRLDKGFRVTTGTPNNPGIGLTVAAVTIIDGLNGIVDIDLGTPIPPGQQVFVTYGADSFYRNTPVAIEAVRAGADYSYTDPRTGTVYTGASTELVFNGDIRGVFGQLTIQGAFFLKQDAARLAILDVRYEGGKTICRGDDLRKAATFNAGAVAGIFRDNPWGNLRDSDNAMSVYRFGDAGTGQMSGQSYPLFNHCVLFHKQLRLA
jgi:hypothetical protein